jgi:hypothetical protein
MNEQLKIEIRNIFTTSSSPDELFDVFEQAVKYKIDDASLYKTLLWNKAISCDEIMMYAEKICKEFPGLCFEIYFAVGEILESISMYGSMKENSFEYFKKSAAANKFSHNPYISAAKMYNAELDIPPFEQVASFVESGIEHVELKSKLCFALSSLYKQRGEHDKERAFQMLGEKFQRKNY